MVLSRVQRDGCESDGVESVRVWHGLHEHLRRGKVKVMGSVPRTGEYDEAESWIQAHLLLGGVAVKYIVKSEVSFQRILSECDARFTWHLPSTKQQRNTMVSPHNLRRLR